MNQQTETVEGFVVDIACVRKYPQDEIAERAKAHTKECALMGHCVESGYVLVSEEGQLALLDKESTPHVVETLKHSSKPEGIKLRAQREKGEEGFETVPVEEIR